MQTGQKEMFFNAHRSKPTPPSVRPIEEQEAKESQRLWRKTAKAVKERNHEVATDEKTKVEDMQREEAAARANDDVEWTPRLFRRVNGGPGGTEAGEEDLEWIINAHMYALYLECSHRFPHNSPRANQKTVTVRHQRRRLSRYSQYIPFFPARLRDVTA